MTDLAPVGRGKPTAELTVDDLPTYPPTLWGLLELRAAATPTGCFWRTTRGAR